MDFAFLILGAEYNPQQHQAGFASDSSLATMYGVPSLEAACELAAQLAEDGVQLIELCGAFGPEGAQAVAQAAGGKVAVGYVTHLPEQEENFTQLFGAKE